MNSILKRLGIERHELNKLVLLVLHSFFSAIFVSIFFSVANAEFVSNFGSALLPKGYLLSGIVGYITVQGYSRLLKKSGYSAFVGGLLFLLVSTILFRCAFYLAPDARWLSFVIFLFAMPFLALSGLEQSGLLLKIYDIREGKRYAGIVNAGGTAASIVGYLSIPVLIPFLNSIHDLFYMAILGLCIALYFLFRLNKLLNLAEQEPAGSNAAVIKSDISLTSLLKQKYIRYIALCGGISMMAFYFVDYSFLINAKKQYSSAAELSAFIGGFFALIKTAELVMSLLSGRIFRSFGLKTGIIILPAVCVLITCCAILADNFSGGTLLLPAFSLFILVIFMLKFFERMVSKAIEEPAYKNLYQLLNAGDRLAIQAKIDGGTKQLFIILASAVLWIYSSASGTPSFSGMVYVSLPFFLVWLFSARQLVKAFKERLRDMLNPGGSESISPVLPFDRLRTMFIKAQQTGNYSNSVLNVLGYKINIPVEEKVIVSETRAAGRYDNFIPAPFFNYLLPAPGRSRLELHLHQPLLVIPPKINSVEAPGLKSQEYLDEKEIIQLALAQEEPDEKTISVLGKKLDNLKQDHEKKLVLNILGRSSHPAATGILVDRLDYPDYYTRKQVFKTLETKNFKYAGAAGEVVYRNAMENILSDVTYILSILSSIPFSDEYTDLRNALAEEESILKNRLLSVLTWKYDRNSIRVIRENIFAGNAATKNSNNILALELVDNLVDREIKPKIMPVFENGAYAWRLSALNKWYNFPQLTTKDALINLVQYDYTRIGIWTKACALKVLLDTKSREYRQIIAGFSYHPNALRSR